MGKSAIEFLGLTKDYPLGFWGNRTRRALDHLTFEVQEQEIFGFLGPNGAGKTTTLKLLMGLIFPTATLGFPKRGESGGVLLKAAAISSGEGIYLFALDVDQPADFARCEMVDQDDHFRASVSEGRQVARILCNVANNDGLAGRNSSAAQPLRRREVSMLRCIRAAPADHADFRKRHIVNADPAIVPGFSNPLRHSPGFIAAAFATGKDLSDLLDHFPAHS